MNVVVSDHSLPQCKIQWFHSSPGKIESYLNEFTRFLEQLEEFYSNINTIDELCFVVDPVQPSTKLNWRIFKIGMLLKQKLNFFLNFKRWIRSKMLCQSGN